MYLEFQFSWLAIILAIVLGIITIYLSALGSSRRAAKISPIDSIRNSGDIKIKAKKLKSPKIINKIFGMGGEIAYKNLKRNKKKYRTTVISIIVSVSIFIALSSFVDLAFLSAKEDVEAIEYNIELTASIQNDEDLYNKILETAKFDKIEEYSIFKNSTILIKNVKYSKEYERHDVSDDYINVCALEKQSFIKYVESIGLKYEDVKDKCILADTKKIQNYDEKNRKVTYEKVREYTYSKSDILNLMVMAKESKDNNDIKLEIAKVSDKKPFGMENDIYSYLIINSDLFDSIYKENKLDVEVVSFYKTENADKLQDNIEESLKQYDIDINNVNERFKMFNNLLTLIAIFLYGFIIVISLIGVTNIFNTITTSMQLRKPEFAMLKSVGMTKKEFNRMIRLENIFMGLKSLFFGMPLGIGLSYLIYNLLAKNYGLDYPLPIKAILISVAVVFILIGLIMKYSMSKINKQNIIETIRNENI